MNRTIQLPQDMTPGSTCFFTGHRVFSAALEREIYPRMVEKILDLEEEGYIWFQSGGAMGFDLLAARTVVLLRDTFHRNIRLFLALPCRDQTSRWLGTGERGLEALRWYHVMKEKADAVVYLQDFYTNGCMQERNRFMAERSTRCIALWNGSRRGGTAQTVRIAREAGIPLYNLYPEKQRG